ncbi:MAG: hypothetical protein J6B56_03625 [Clostridia bacterium]|nr:hypothetical protein [Clostridia bacterium]
MNENALKEKKIAYFSVLEKFSLYDLRSYGRWLNLSEPTKLKKGDLLPLIVGVLAGEITPVGRNNRGAPVKNKHVNPEIIQAVEEVNKRYSTEETEKYEDFSQRFEETQMRNGRSVLTFESNNKSETEEWSEQVAKRVFVGQLQKLNEVPRLLPIDFREEAETVVVPMELIREHELREGDVVACHTEKGKSAFVAREVLTINEMQLPVNRRGKFEDEEACYPDKPVQFSSDHSDFSPSVKYLQWLLPLYQGQRGCIVSSPKAGKTSLLYEIATSAIKSARGLRVLVLLNAQSVETVWRFRNAVPQDRLVYTTYDDSPERQVFAAEFLLKRAKRFAESGKNVLLLIDSLNALGKAYNETEESMGGKVLAGGLESKTLQYLRRFFGSARCFTKGGSLTMLATVSNETGNPADDLIAMELLGLANYQIRLSQELAAKRIYPAIDLLQSGTQTGFADGEEEFKRQELYRAFLSEYGEERLLELLASAENYEAFLRKMGVKI